MFLSLNELLSGLLDVANMKDVSLWEGSAFLDYVNTRKSHSRLAVEPSLVENEIGGVIVGSLRAAQAGRALTPAEYLMRPTVSVCGSISSTLTHDTPQRDSLHEKRRHAQGE